MTPEHILTECLCFSALNHEDLIQCLTAHLGMPREEAVRHIDTMVQDAPVPTRHCCV